MPGLDACARPRRQVSPEDASARIAAINEPYKQEILDGILARTPDAPITLYHIGGGEHAEHWWDLCGGPHVASTGKINPAAIDLESLAGAGAARRGCYCVCTLLNHARGRCLRGLCCLGFEAVRNQQEVWLQCRVGAHPVVQARRPLC